MTLCLGTLSDIVCWHPSVSKSNWLHVDIFHLLWINAILKCLNFGNWLSSRLVTSTFRCLRNEGSFVHPYKSGKFHLPHSFAQTNPLWVQLWAHIYDQGKVSLIQANLSLSLSSKSKEGIPFTSTIKKSLHLSHVVEKTFTFIMTRIPFLSLSMFLYLFGLDKGVVMVFVVLVVGFVIHSIHVLSPPKQGPTSFRHMRSGCSNEG